jgi:hypothetical protein
MSIESLPQNLVYRSLNHLQKRNKLTEIVLLVGDTEPESEPSSGSPEIPAAGCFPWSHMTRHDAVSKKDGGTQDDIADEKSSMIKAVMIQFSTEDLGSFAGRFRVALAEAEKAVQSGDTVLITVRSTKTPLPLLSRNLSGEASLSAFPPATLPPKPSRGRGHSSGALKASKVAVETDAERTGNADPKQGYDPSSMARDKDNHMYADMGSARDLTARPQELSAFWKPIVCASTALACALADASAGRIRRSEELSVVAAEDTGPNRNSFSIPSGAGAGASHTYATTTTTTTTASPTRASSPVDCMAYLDAVDKAAPWVLKQCPRDFLVLLLEYSLAN